MVRSRTSASVKTPRNRPTNGVVDAGVVNGKPLRVRHGQPLLFAQLVFLRASDTTIEILVEPLLLDPVGTEGQAHGALVELRDAHARRLADAYGQDALVVGGIDETHRRTSQSRLQRPDLHRVPTLSGRNIDASHEPTLCQYSFSQSNPGGPNAGKREGRDAACSLQLRFGPFVRVGERSVQPASDQHRDSRDHRMVRSGRRRGRLAGPRCAHQGRTAGGGRETHVGQLHIRPRAPATDRRATSPHDRGARRRGSSPTVHILATA